MEGEPLSRQVRHDSPKTIKELFEERSRNRRHARDLGAC